MNKKGQGIFLGIVIGLSLFIVGALFINFIDPEGYTDGSDGAIDDLNCGTSENPTDDISDGAKLTCLIMESVVPYFIIIIISTAGGIMAARFLT